MSKDSILRLKSSLLYKTLLKRESTDNFESKLSTKIDTIVSDVSPLLHRIPENMPEFTMHDPNHSAKIVEIIGKFLPPSTLQSLNSIELTLLILSSYVHDIGMTSSKDERDHIISTNTDYNLLFKTASDKKEKYEYYKSIDDHRSATFIEDQIYTEYLRRNHVKRSAEFIKDKLSSGHMSLEIDGIPFWKQLITICNGHGESVKSISNIDNFPRQTLVGETVINIQFLTLILRLGDILDLDPERTPKVIYEYLDPKDPTSLLEWKKHRSIIGYSITPEKILFEAECTSPEVERALKEFIFWIELERKETMQLLRDSKSPYELYLIEEVTLDRIRSDGSYIYNDLKFEIDYKRVMELLMGQRLYRSPIFSIRELLQNSNDAIKARENIYKKKGEKFTPRIYLNINEDKFSIGDNGLGMDLKTFQNYFLQIGKSLYSSADFYNQYSEIDVTSEFGIGVLSVFMIATSMTVESRRQPESHDSLPKPILFEIPTAHSYTVQKETEKDSIGTKITLKLKSVKPFKNHSLKEILSLLIPNPPFPIHIEENGEDFFLYEGIQNIEINTLPEVINHNEITNYVVNDFEDTEKFTHSFFEIDFTESENSLLTSINGKLNLVNSGQHNWYSLLNGNLCQRNFCIGSLEQDKNFRIVASRNIINLFPAWLSYYSTLNLTKSSCLSLTPDRTDVIIDEKYDVLKQSIEDHIIKKLSNHFNSYTSSNSEEEFYAYMDLIIATGFINVDHSRRNIKFSENAINFLRRYISFPVVNPNGSKKRMSSAEIVKYSTIGYVKNDLDNTLADKIISSIDVSNTIILDLNSMSYEAGLHPRINEILHALLVDNGEITQSIFKITSALPSFTINIIKNGDRQRQELDYNYCLNISETLDLNGKQILCVNRQKYEYFMLLNANHDLIKPFFNDNLILEREVENLIEDIREAIHENIEKSVKQRLINEKKVQFKDIYSIGENTNFYALNKGLISLDSDFLPAVNEDIRLIWSDLIKCGFISDNTPFTMLTESDFPSYWSDPV